MDLNDIPVLRELLGIGMIGMAVLSAYARIAARSTDLRRRQPRIQEPPVAASPRR